MPTCYSTLSATLQAEAEAYVEHGHRPSPLLLAALEANLYQALDALPADMPPAEQLALLRTLKKWALEQAPLISRGAVEMTLGWMDGGGKQGRAAARQAAAAIHAARSAAQEAAHTGQPHLRLVTEDDGAEPAVNVHTLADALASAVRRGVL